MNPTNYRSTSLLTSFPKVFEKALCIRLTEHFYSNKLLLGNQFGFRKGIAIEDTIFIPSVYCDSDRKQTVSWMTIIYLLGRTSGNEMKHKQEADLAYCVVLFWHLLQWTERNNNKRQAV